ncbi:unnamed protein product [Lactuca saligna]|uniref:Uncharacterized protein n=1 Tax=Lactuca saligna TaxID=75948 RepID=A0AA35YG11_LACSI|nr:unnamed protein product [Lactuca saligna]
MVYGLMKEEILLGSCFHVFHGDTRLRKTKHVCMACCKQKNPAKLIEKERFFQDCLDATFHENSSNQVEGRSFQ